MTYQITFFWNKQFTQLLLFGLENNKLPFGVPCIIKTHLYDTTPFNACPLYTFNLLDKKMGLLKWEENDLNPEYQSTPINLSSSNFTQLIIPYYHTHAK